MSDHRISRADEYIEAGDRKILTSGLWGVARHFNYMGEGFLALSVALSFGHFDNPWAWTYMVFVVSMFTWRQMEDDKACATHASCGRRLSIHKASPGPSFDSGLRSSYALVACPRTLRAELWAPGRPSRNCRPNAVNLLALLELAVSFDLPDLLSAEAGTGVRAFPKDFHPDYEASQTGEVRAAEGDASQLCQSLEQ